MEKLISELGLELGKSINSLEKTFDGKLNWHYHKKVEILGKMLDELLELEQKEKLLLNK